MMEEEKKVQKQLSKISLRVAKEKLEEAKTIGANSGSWFAGISIPGFTPSFTMSTVALLIATGHVVFAIGLRWKQGPAIRAREGETQVHNNFCAHGFSDNPQNVQRKHAGRKQDDIPLRLFSKDA